MSPGKESHSSYSVPLIPGDMSPGKVLKAAQERGLAVIALLAFVAMKSQGNPGFPFETHSQMAKIPIACFVIYGLLYAAVYLVKLLAPNPNPNPNPRLVARAHIGRIGLMWIVVASLVSLLFY
ncbi:hypothetical protein Tco_1512507 [Tanacetum coccineum]